MKYWSKTYGIALAIFLVVDAVWIMGFALNLYKTELGDLVLPAPSMLPAVLFYLLFVLGLVVLVIEPNKNKQISLNFVFKSALFGLVCYATYAMTNLSIISSWSTMVSVVDTIWGAVVAMITASLTHFLTTKQEIS